MAATVNASMSRSLITSAGKVLLALSLLALICNYLNSIGLLIPVIGIGSIVYLVLYALVGTFVVFSAVGEIFSESGEFQENILLNLIISLLLVIFFWVVCLLFWPLLVAPDEAFARKKFKSITEFEEKLKAKYGSTSRDISSE